MLSDDFGVAFLLPTLCSRSFLLALVAVNAHGTRSAGGVVEDGGLGSSEEPHGCGERGLRFER